VPRKLLDYKNNSWRCLKVCINIFEVRYFLLHTLRHFLVPLGHSKITIHVYKVHFLPVQPSQFGYVNKTKGHERMAARGTRVCGTGTTTSKHVNIQIKSAIECASKCHRILHSDLWLPAIQDGKFIALHLALSQTSGAWVGESPILFTCSSGFPVTSSRVLHFSSSPVRMTLTGNWHRIAAKCQGTKRNEEVFK